VLIVEANNIAAEMDEEVSNLHKFAKDKYSMRFPELETLVVQPLDYLLTAKELRNNVRLFGFYSSHLISQFLSLSLSHTHAHACAHTNLTFSVWFSYFLSL
jgi:RNA processing factor Prp31